MSAVNILNQDGSVSAYTKLSNRLPAFFEKYPIGDGYRLVSTSRDYLSENKGLMVLAEKLLEKDLSLETLQNVISLNSRLFICELRDETNDLVASASALKKIVEYKDYETGETAALQRLLAKLGFGGEVLDNDESNDFADQEIVTKQEASPTPATVSEIKPEPVRVTPEVVSGNKPPKTAAISPALLRQLRLQADLIGEPCPTVTTNAEAKSALKKIRNRKK